MKERKLIISGVREEKGENVRQVALKIIKKALSIAKAAQEKEDYDGVTFAVDPNQISLSSLEQAYRIGTKSLSWPPRNLLVSFKDAHHRYILLKTKQFLGEDESVNFFLEEDMTSAPRTHRSKMKRIVAAAKNENLDTKMSGNRVFIDGVPYGVSDLDNLPSGLVGRTKVEKEVEGGIAYRGPESIFSNFYMCFFDIDGTRYKSVEQFYQYTKAVECNNLERARKIMKCTDPRRIKELGDGVKNKNDWASNRVSTLYKGTLAKFQQNPDLAIELVSTGSVGLYEATTDKFFGCGVGLQSKKWITKDWFGENVAGRIVMKVRAELSGVPPAPDATLDVYDDGASISASLNDTSSESPPTRGEDMSLMKTQSEDPVIPSAVSDQEPSHHGFGHGRNKRSNRRHGSGRGRGRGSPSHGHSQNVTGRYYRRQSGFKSQLSSKDADFLKVNNPAPLVRQSGSPVPMEITTSTPKAPKEPSVKKLSDSELVAMGVDPNSKYAEDIRLKYSSS